MNILGLKVSSHEPGAALVYGEKVVAIGEERLNRIKHSTGIFPQKAIEYCLKTANLSPADIDLVVLDQVGSRQFHRSEDIFKKHTGDLFYAAKIVTINHHDAHAAAAFFCSPFDEAAVLIVDGSGEKIHNHLGIVETETETLYAGRGNVITEIQKTGHIRRKMIFPFTIGIGKLYSLISEAYLNFGHYNEGKMMGLAPYGDDRVLRKYPMDQWFAEYGNHVVCNPNIAFQGKNDWLETKKARKGFSGWVSRTIEKFGFFLLDAATSGRTEFFKKPEIFKPIALDLPRRGKNDPLPEPYYAAAAYAVQKVLEEVMVRLGKKVKAITGTNNLCVAGGVGLNIDANKRFLDDVGFEHVFVQPASSDAGIALGCALWGAHMIAGRPRFWEMKSASLGRTYAEAEIVGAMEKVKDKIIFHKSKNVFEETAKLISEQKIIGWFQGGSEYGPRALGNRSIVVDARSAEMKDIVNARVKHREGWRPFAASIVAEEQSNWFDLKEPSPFMLLAAQVHEDKKKLVPSIVHVDGTCRIQSVTPESNERYYKLLKAFQNLTGVPLVLNTSFNVAGEPIVETPEDALRCFLGTNFDYLILGDYIVAKK